VIWRGGLPALEPPSPSAPPSKLAWTAAAVNAVPATVAEREPEPPEPVPPSLSQPGRARRAVQRRAREVARSRMGEGAGSPQPPPPAPASAIPAAGGSRAPPRARSGHEPLLQREADGLGAAVHPELH